MQVSKRMRTVNAPGEEVVPRTQCPPIVGLQQNMSMAKMRHFNINTLPVHLFENGPPYVCPASDTHEHTQHMYAAYLAQYMPQVIRAKNMSTHCLQQQYLELQAAHHKQYPAAASAPRHISVWLLIKCDKVLLPRKSGELEYVRHLVDGFVHLFASASHPTCISETIRSTVLFGDDAETVAKHHNQGEVFVSAITNAPYQACVLVAWCDANGSINSCAETLTDTNFYIQSKPATTSAVEIRYIDDGRPRQTFIDVSEGLRHVISQLFSQLDNTLILHSRAILRQIPKQPPYALRVHLARISARFARTMTPWPFVSTEIANMHKETMDSQGWKFCKTGHEFRMVPAPKLNELFSLHKISFHHNGVREISSFAKTVYIDESAPAYGMCIDDGPNGSRRRAANEYFSCNNGWHLPMANLSMSEQSAGLHLFGALTTQVSFDGHVSAFPATPIQSSPNTGCLSAVYSFVLPITPEFFKDMFILPMSTQCFLPTDKRFRYAYDSLLRLIWTTADQFEEFPTDANAIRGSEHALSTQMTRPDEFNDVADRVAAHVAAIDATFSFMGLRSNTEITTVGAACHHLAKIRAQGSTATARLMSHLCYTYGANVPIEWAVNKLCDDLDKFKAAGMTSEETLDLRRFVRTLGL